VTRRLLLVLVVLAPWQALTAKPLTYGLIQYVGGGCIGPSYEDTCSVSQPIVFHVNQAYSSSGPVVWDFGDGSPSVTANVSSQISRTFPIGSYGVTLRLPSGANDARILHVGYGDFDVSGPNSISEANGPAVFTITRTHGPTSATVSYGTSDQYGSYASRYVATSGTLSFAAGELSKTVSVLLVDDHVYNDPAYFTFSLLSSSSGYPRRHDQWYVTIIDDDPPPTFAFSADHVAVNEADGRAVLSVKRTGDLLRTVNLAYGVGSSVPRPDMVRTAGGTITFAPGQTSGTIEIPIAADPIYEGTSTVMVGLRNPDQGGLLANPSTVLVEIGDNDPMPTVQAIPPIRVRRGTGTTDISFDLRLSGAVQTASVSALPDGGTAVQGTDYDFSGDTFSFSPTVSSRTCTLRIHGNPIPGPDKTLNVRLQASGATLNTPVVNITIVNDQFTLTSNNVMIPLGATERFALNLGAPQTSPVTISISSDPPGIIKHQSTLTIPAGTNPASITVEGLKTETTWLTVQLPPSLFGVALTSHLWVIDAATPVFDTERLSLPVGRTGTIVLSILPSQTEERTVTLMADDPSLLTLPPMVTVPPAGSVSIPVTARKRGTTVIRASLGPLNGGTVAALPVSISDALPVQALDVSPSSAVTGGGTIVTLRGTRFDMPCSVLFGDNPAVSVQTIDSSTLTAAAPPHAEGVVLLSVACSTAEYAVGFRYVNLSRHRPTGH
jgi:hypothetical protein